MNFIKENIAYIAITVAVLAVGIFAVLPMMPSIDNAEGTFVSSVLAFGTPDTGAGDSGGDCCGGVSGGTGGSSGGFGTPDTGAGDSGGDCCDAPEPPTYNPPEPPNNPAPVCNWLRANNQTGTVKVPYGTDKVGLTWSTTNAKGVWINGEKMGSTNKQNNPRMFNINDNGKTTFNLVAKNDGQQDTCKVVVVMKEAPAAKCDFLKINGQAGVVQVPYGTNQVTLTWGTTNADFVTLNSNKVANDNTSGYNASITGDKTFTLVAKNTSNGSTNSCIAKVDMQPPTPIAMCLTFEADPTRLPENGGTTNLTWTTKNADHVQIKNVTTGAIYNVAKNNAVTGRDFNINETTVFQLIVTGTDGSKDKHCTVNVTVDTDEEKLTCDDVDFTASDTKVDKGDKVTLYWDASNEVDDVYINNGIGDVPNQGNERVEVTRDITYRITISNDDDSVSCPLDIDVDSGGGGGGSSGPRCDINISKDRVRLGEEVTLSWDTFDGDEITIVDDDGNIIIDSDDEDDMDGEIDIEPIKDTYYTLTVRNDNNVRKCRVDVDVRKPDVTVTETRSQEPRVAGISLTTVPYTGFEAGPALTILFYVLLTLWALYVAYILVIKRDSLGGVSFAGSHTHNKYSDASVDEGNGVNEAEAYVASATTATVPSNLPTAAPEKRQEDTNPTVGYASVAATEELDEETESEFAALEELAHSKRVLMSTDAMRYIASEHGTGEKAIEALSDIIAEAKVTFPNEDGWVVLNLSRVESLVGELKETEKEAVAEVAAPESTGSLAEAIVTGNIVAAYKMIDHRPMVALAAAAADLDALYRARKGEDNNASELLKSEANKLNDEQLESAISALTGALDGTYTSEAEAVKMAIMKAVQALS